MVQIIKLDHLEYKEAILDSPDYREKLRKHEKHIAETSKNIKILVKKFEDVINASEALKNAQDSFSECLKDFQIGFVGDTNEEETDIVDTLDCTYNLFQDINEFSTNMINTGHTLIKQLEAFRKDKIDTFKEKKKEYERQTIRYCTTIEKYLQSSQSSKKERNNEESSADFSNKEIDRVVREENQMFYQKCLDYALCIQEFEEKWFHFFSESVFAFSQSWTTFYHEGYEKYIDCENRFNKSHGGIQALRNNFDYFKSKSKELISDILKDPEYYISSYQTMSPEHNMMSSKQGYLYLIEKKTLGSSTRVKQFCKYYKELKKLEVVSFNQTTNKMHAPEVYYVNNCQKSSSDKRFIFDVSLRDKTYTNVHTYQSLSYDDYKAWFAVLEGKELTPVLSSYSIKTDPVYILDRNGINFIQRCIQLLEEEKLNEEGIYRKNGVSHKINTFIEKNFLNISLSTVVNNGNGVQNGNDNNYSNENNQNNSLHAPTNSSFISSVLKSANIPMLSHSSSFSALNFLGSSQNNSVNDSPRNENHHHHPPANTSHPTTPSTVGHLNHSQNNLAPPINSGPQVNELEDTCTITSALKHYLIHLKEPLMTFSFNQQFLIACRKENLVDRITEIHKLLISLPPVNFEAIKLLMKHLYKVSTHSKQNKMTTSNLATCFGPTVFRTEQECVSNLYNIKFYSEIVELLIINNDKIFQPVLDSSFLNNLIPLKSPPTMISGTMTDLSSVNNSANNSLISPSKPLVNTSSQSNTKLRPSISINSNPVNRRGMYEPNNTRNGLLNSTLSSDSSQSDREQQLNNSNNLITSQQITSPISSSSPTHFHHKNESNFNNTNPSISNISSLSNNNIVNNYILNRLSHIPSITTQNQSAISSLSLNQTNSIVTMAKPLTSSTSSSTSSSSLSNQNGLPIISIPIHSLTNSHSIQNIPKPYKPFNSQNGQYNQRESVDSTGIHKLNFNNDRTSIPLSSSNLVLSQYGSNNKNINSSPINSRNSNNNSRSITPVITTTNNSNNSITINDTTTENTKTRRARTLYPCEADNPSELSFEANVIISNIRRSKEAGWLEGTFNGKSGLVPGNYVQILDD